MKSLIFSALAFCLTTLSARAEAEWIWFSAQAGGQDKGVLTKEFTLKGPVKSAVLEYTCDNSGSVLLNGKMAGQTTEWREPVKKEVKDLLTPGANRLEFHVANDGGAAAAILRIRIAYDDGTKEVLTTDGKWTGTKEGAQTAAVAVVGKLGDGPWGDVFAAGGGNVLAGADVVVPEGFRAELLHVVEKSGEGSWVALTETPDGKLIAADQYGGLFRITPPALGVKELEGATKVEPIEVALSDTGVALRGAHGLLWAFDSLYVVVNEGDGKGLWRLRDKNADGKFEETRFLRKFEGGGEHGPHSAVLSPDGKSLFIIIGNHTQLPEQPYTSRPVKWAEDHLTPRMWDANGHAQGILAPGGYVCRVDPEGQNAEIVSIGFRNEFDAAFDQNGELFTYDSDMEWDIGAPWYRPTRIAQAVSGGDNGWRSGSGKWPSYYPDSVPPVLDIGPGSPTGVLFGTGAKYPEKYQLAFFALDWTYGTMYAIHLKANGGAYTAEKSEFVSGKPLPLTDAIIRKADGVMYFAIGGRRTQSALYRVVYEGAEPTTPVTAPALTEGARTRRALETLHSGEGSVANLTKAWPALSSPDRSIRFAARVAVEHVTVSAWRQKALDETSPVASLEALLALARMGEKSDLAPILKKLIAFPYDQSDVDTQLAYWRVWEVAMSRHGLPDEALAGEALAIIDGRFPARDARLNVESIQVLAALGSPTIVAKAVPMLATARDEGGQLADDELLARNSGYAQAAKEMEASRPNRYAISIAYTLRSAKAGWTPELRKQFFSWFPLTKDWRGGNSFTKFLENIRQESLSTVADTAERGTLDELSRRPPAPPPANIAFPKGPGKAYSIDDVVTLVNDRGLKGRDFSNGRDMFTATGCAACHPFAGGSGMIGPDITGSANRYTMRDLAENIIDPSAVISDQYGTDQISLKDGSTVIGRVMSDSDGIYKVLTDPWGKAERVEIASSQVKSLVPYPISMMPPGLINSLNEDELLNLIAYIMSGGREDSEMFAK